MTTIPTNHARPKIVVCLGSSCYSRDNGEVINVIEEYLLKNGYRDKTDRIPPLPNLFGISMAKVSYAAGQLQNSFQENCIDPLK
ncbi:MAG: hypothetical protein LBQ50_14570 [Planctomycetaceae bacterium]|jgi:hypothetical protein|nr:hypothetical protein [Planctomycetaceae bacterium]